MGSPDLGIVLLFALECSPPQPQIEQGNGRFRFFARHSKFSKGALRAVGAVAWAAASGGTKTCAPRRCTAKLLVTARCAVQAFFICCGCGSSAASSRAVQLEQPKASKREREQESRGSKSIARSSRSLQDAFAVDFCSPPPLFVKENDHFHSPSQKNPPAAPPKMATLPCFLLGAALRGQNRLP